MAEPQPQDELWQLAIDRLRVALPACRVDMRAADYKSIPLAGGGRRRRAAQYAAGRLAAAVAGVTLTGTPSFVGRSPDGAPVWPDGLRGSISHCGGQSVALVGHSVAWRGLGVDIEKYFSDQIAQEVAPIALTSSERAMFGNDPIWLAQIFSAKESLFKALSPHINRRFDFDAAELHVDLSGRAPRLRLTCDLAPNWPKGRMIDTLMIQCPAGVLTAVALPA